MYNQIDESNYSYFCLTSKVQFLIFNLMFCINLFLSLHVDRNEILLLTLLKIKEDELNKV